MAFPLLGLLPSILRTIASITGLAPVKDAAEALASAQLSPEKQEELQEALLRHEQAMKSLSNEELKTVVSESLAMIQSEDKFVKRARPLGLYCFYAASLAAVFAVVGGVHVDAVALLTILAPLGGVSGTYVVKRTQEKLATNGGIANE